MKIFMEHKGKIYKLAVGPLSRCDASMKGTVICPTCCSTQRLLNQLYCRGAGNLQKSFDLNIPTGHGKTYIWRLYHDGT